MAAKSTYWELLRRPEWQEKRLRIMERANFHCESCGSKETTLNVHHKYYTKGAKPWEYPNEALACLCETCHGELHQVKRNIDQSLANLSVAEYLMVLGFVKAMQMVQPWTDENEMFVVGSYEESFGLVLGMADPKFSPECAIDLMDGPGLTPKNMKLMLEGIDVRTPLNKPTSQEGAK